MLLVSYFSSLLPYSEKYNATHKIVARIYVKPWDEVERLNSVNCNAKLIFLIGKLGILNYYFLIMDQPTKFLISIFDEGKLFLIQTLCEGMSFSLKQKNWSHTCWLRQIPFTSTISIWYPLATGISSFQTRFNVEPFSVPLSIEAFARGLFQIDVCL